MPDPTEVQGRVPRCRPEQFLPHPLLPLSLEIFRGLRVAERYSNKLNGLDPSQARGQGRRGREQSSGSARSVPLSLRAGALF